MRIKLGISYSIDQIAQAVKGRLYCSGDQMITHISTDSREVLPGDLFFALNGVKQSGEDFALEAKEKGAIVVSQTKENAHVFVNNTSDALLSFASFYCKSLPYILYKIGITGSVGKTTTKEFAKIILSQKYKVHATSGNFNNEIGMPLSLLSAPRETQVLIMEMGMNHTGEISRLSNCLRPNIGIITNIGRAHIGNLGSREAIAAAKLEILDGMDGGMLFIPYGESLLSSASYGISVSFNNTGADICLIDQENDSVSVLLNKRLFCKSVFRLREPQHKICLAFSAGLGLYLGLSPSELSRGISLISRNNTRQNIVLKGGRCFITDFYNASPESVEACIEAAKYISDNRPKNLLLGDMLELGERSAEIHQEVAKKISSKLFKNLYVFGNFSENTEKGAIESGFPCEHIFINKDLTRPDVTAKQIKEFSAANELIIMKASRGVRLERVLDYFEGKAEDENG